MSEPVNNTESLLNKNMSCNEVLESNVLLETSKGFIWKPLNDGIIDLNLTINSKPKKDPNLLGAPRMTCDSDGGFSSECSDSTYTTASSSTFSINLNLPRLDSGIMLDDVMSRPKDRENKSSEESDSTLGRLRLLSSDTCLSPHQVLIKKKGRGGWPKGRKRKPELLNLPPKAPATGYNLYLNEQRSCFKNSSLQFYEITKIVGNKWSSLTLEEKKPYLDRAEEEKKRYREELRQYRQSEAYRAYLNKKRKKRLQNNVLSESDMDATDDFDEEDNEELYCRTCDQWFHSLHNKREHLQAKKHLTSLAGEMHRELSDIETSTNKTESSAISNLDESSFEGSSFNAPDSTTIYEAMCRVTSLFQKRELEIRSAKIRHQEAIEEHKALTQQLSQLRDRELHLQKDLQQKRKLEKELEAQVFHLWQVPSLFVMSHFEGSSIDMDFS